MTKQGSAVVHTNRPTHAEMKAKRKANGVKPGAKTLNRSKVEQLKTAAEENVKSARSSRKTSQYRHNKTATMTTQVSRNHFGEATDQGALVYKDGQANDHVRSPKAVMGQQSGSKFIK